MKIKLLVVVEVPAGTDPQRVRKLTKDLLDIGLSDAQATVDEGDGDLDRAEEVTKWTYRLPQVVQ